MPAATVSRHADGHGPPTGDLYYLRNTFKRRDDKSWRAPWNAQGTQTAPPTSSRCGDIVKVRGRLSMRPIYVLYYTSLPQQTLPHVAAVEPQHARRPVCCRHSRVFHVLHAFPSRHSLVDMISGVILHVPSFLAVQTAGATHGVVDCGIRWTRPSTQALA